MISFSIERLGKGISQLRTSLGLSQAELAKGICTQAQISKIEKGQAIPSAETIYYISERLGVDVNYFFDMAKSSREDYVKEVMSQIRKAIRNRDYLEVMNTVLEVQGHPLFQSSINKQFLMWHHGIATFYLESDSEKALNLLHDSLLLTAKNKEFYSEREVEILNSIGIIHSELGDHIEAMSFYQKGIEHLKHLPFLHDQLLKVRLMYNLAKSLTKIGSYRESLKYCEKGIKACLKNESLYLLGEFYYQKGYNLFHVHKNDEAIAYMNKAIFIFGLQGNEIFIQYVQEEVDQFVKKLQK
ncbi:helix-turn-helix domain-containing protein [Tepidibacillus sp. HK-1]|uniref:helix-turn-helix domain-containing protein n=1 Tax=Tepidibacillus sp. HK-1 TaxID=1883407 RepID=UPI0008529ED7|nr:helix-turn-helix domain-containing protein [Tepidibacillus sp. HK-1]GBF10316.1 helix-turn-helix domain protein [Tepidibacillus sp. HK-1]